MSTRPDDPSSFLPVDPTDYQVLFVLHEAERHGYAMVKTIEARTEGRVRLEPSNLYRRIRRLIRDGLVEECEDRPAPELDDERRRYYGLTPTGRAVLIAEAERMRRLVTEAEAGRLLTSS